MRINPGINRRKFLQYAGAGATSLLMDTWRECSAGEATASLQGTGLSLPCCVGDVSADGAMVWLRTERTDSVAVEYAKNSSFQGAVRTAPLVTRSDNDFTAKWSLGNLEPATNYFYRAVVAEQKPGPAARFVTAPGPDTAASFRFAFSGDTRQNHQPFSIMDAIRENKPDFFLHLGDTIYGDREGVARTLAQYHGKYATNRRDEPTQRLFAETSLMVVWDDHEVADNYRAAHPLAPVGRRAFMDYWPIRQDLADQDRIYRSQRWGKTAELFILDTRQYRNETVGTILGAEQKHWVLDALSNSSARFKLICTWVPFSSPNKDKWGGYLSDRDEVVKTIRDKKISGVIFLAADVHYAAVARVPGVPTLREVIAGPLAAPMGQGTGREKRFDYFNNQHLNYGLVNVHEDGDNSHVDIEILTDKNLALHKVRFSASEKPDS
jgi:alkaline phosphatase D